jgi:hypothetical protein
VKWKRAWHKKLSAECNPAWTLPPSIVQRNKQVAHEWPTIRYNYDADYVEGYRNCHVGAVMVSFTDKISVPSHVLVRFLDKESVLLNLETERYFGLDETGTRMWQLATTAPNIEATYRQLLDEYDVDAETLRQNLTELLDKLADNGLLTMTPSDVGTTPAI